MIMDRFDIHEGSQAFDMLRTAFADEGTYKVAIRSQLDGVAIKINEGAWSHRLRMKPEEQETFLGQIKINGKWEDYARGTRAKAWNWQQADPANRRVVDWIYKDKIIFGKDADTAQ